MSESEQIAKLRAMVERLMKYESDADMNIWERGDPNKDIPVMRADFDAARAILEETKPSEVTPPDTMPDGALP